MSVKKCPITGKYKTDFYVNKKRIRETFDVREDAREFERAAKITGKLGVSINEDAAGKPLDIGILEYQQLETEGKVSASDEKAFLREFYSYLHHVEGLEFFPQVKLIHLSRYQKFLQSAKDRDGLWEMVEVALKRQSKENKTQYVPRKKPKFIGLSGSSVNRHMNSICDLFTWAKRWEWISSHPGAEIEPVAENPQKRKPWPSDKHIQTAIDRAKPWAQEPFYLIAETGIRPVGAKKLTWADVDFENRRFRIESRKGRNGKLREHWVLMTEAVHQFFLHMWANRQVGKYGHLVFHSAEGLQLDTKALAREMARITKSIGLHGYTLYGFRHKVGQAATNPSKDGTRDGNIEFARQMLGHASIKQTQHYNETEDSVLRAQMEKIAKERNLSFRKEG